MVLVDQPTASPTSKWWAARSAGIATLIVSIIALTQIDISADQVTAALTGVGSLIVFAEGLAGYFKRNKAV